VAQACENATNKNKGLIKHVRGDRVLSKISATCGQVLTQPLGSWIVFRYSPHVIRISS